MTTEERLERLEAELAETKAGLAGAKRLTRRLIAGTGVVLVMFALFVAIRVMTGVAYSQAGGDVAKVIRAKSFEVVDNQGRNRATLTMTKAGPGLVLFDENGKARAGLVVSKEGPFLGLYDEKGAGRALLIVDEDGSGLRMSDENGETRAALAVLKVGPGLILGDEKGISRTLLNVTKDGPSLQLLDEKGTDRATLGVSQTGTPDGKSTTYPESSLLLFGPDSKVIWSAPR
jgi:hypothetical protein